MREVVDLQYKAGVCGVGKENRGVWGAKVMQRL